MKSVVCVFVVVCVFIFLIILVLIKQEKTGTDWHRAPGLKGNNHMPKISILN